jgi:putative membrane protein
MGQGAGDFLGTQGDIWDTQPDMFFALVGAITALLVLTRWHDLQIREM